MRFVRIVALASAVVGGPVSAATLGSLAIADSEFADSISSATGAINTYVATTPGNADLNTISATEAGTGSNVDSGIWCTADCTFYIEFVDNAILNSGGVDLAIFEGGANEDLSITINSVTTVLSAAEMVVELGFVDSAEFQVGYWLVDLDDFGVAPGGAISSFFVDLLYDESIGTGFASADFVAASGLTPPSEVPLPAGIPLLLSALIALGIVRRKRT